jgi:hypothetical protein
VTRRPVLENSGSNPTSDEREITPRITHWQAGSLCLVTNGVVTTRILSSLTTSFLRLPPRGKHMTTAPHARSPLLFFVGRQSYPLNPTQSPQRTDSAFYASAYPKRPPSSRKICDAEVRRWSLRVPASGLPEDMVHMLEEFEKLAVELGQALPKIVVMFSAESLSMNRIARFAAAAHSPELLLPPQAPAVGDESAGRV